MPDGARCPLCGGGDLDIVFELRRVPALCNQLWPDEASARSAAVCDVALALCNACTLLSNVVFEEGRIDYAPGYENALHFSPRFQAFAEELTAGLAERHNLRGKDVVEIGCGDGHILDLMMQNGARSATGFDPSMKDKPSIYAATPGVEIVPEYFRSDQLDRHFDALLCRHVLEHLPDPMSVLSDIRKAIGKRDCAVYFEVPNAEWMLEDVSMWDVIYEHVTYWGEPALKTLFRRTGFVPNAIRSGFGGQFMMAEVGPGEPEVDYLPDVQIRELMRTRARTFGTATTAEISKWRQRLTEFVSDGRKAVVWGAGSKGVTFVNAVGAEAGAAIAALVDVNTRKHGMFAPGVALPVVEPDALPSISPDLVIVANNLYLDEIRRMVGDQGLSPEFLVIAG